MDRHRQTEMLPNLAVGSRRLGLALLGLLCAEVHSNGTAAAPAADGNASASTSNPPLAVRPLPPRAERSGPLFTTLSPAETGIVAVNTFDDPRMWTDRYEEFAFGSLGTGVAIADVDNDDRLDVFVVAKTGRSRLYRNLGDWRFEDATEAAGIDDAGGAWKQGAAFADVNNDGRVDLYLCRNGAPNLLYLNEGGGRFSERGAAAGLDLADASVMAAFGDYDRDGWLDVFVQTSLLDHETAPRGQRDRLFRNRGDGTFEEVTERAGLFGQTQGHSAIWWDYDVDGWPDLYVANDFAAPDQLYRNRGDGTFAEVLGAVVPHFPHFSMGSDIADVDNDGHFDLFVADMLPSQRDHYIRGMINIQATMARDLPPGLAAQYMRNALFLNTGKGLFREAAYLAGLAATDWTWSVRFEDFDEDGRVDLHVTNGMVRDFFDGDLVAKISALPLAQRKEVVRASVELREKNHAFRNRGDLSFEPVAEAWGLDHYGISFGCATGDLDGDGDTDLIFSNFDAPPTVCRNETAKHHRVLLTLRTRGSGRPAAGAVVRIETDSGEQVRTLTLARGYQSSSSSVLHFGLGRDTRLRRVHVRWPNGSEQVWEDLPADQHYTLEAPSDAAGETGKAVEAAASARAPEPWFTEVSGAMSVLAAPGEKPVDELSREPLAPARNQAVGPGLAFADVDSDGAEDMIVGGLVGAPLQLWTRIGDAFFPGGNPVLGRRTEMADGAPLALDVNGDGALDLVVPKAGVNRPAGDAAYAPRLLLGIGGGYFREADKAAQPQATESVGPLAAADWNGDGWVDLFFGARAVPGDYAGIPRSALWVNEGQGNFVDATETLAPGLARCGRVTSALWSDVDQDGRLDLVVAGHWMGVRVWRNVEGRRFEDATERFGFSEAGAGFWNSIVAADFNGDGKMDYALGNHGLNTRYRASAEAPLLLYHGVFDSTGRERLVEAETIDGRIVPFRGRQSFLSAIPGAARAAPTYAAYAAADLKTLVAPERLAEADRWEVTELRSGVLLSQGERYAFRALPHEAQIAPLFGLAAADFDGDGPIDLVVVQNTDAPHPQFGRAAGGVGQFLRGEGDGSFDPVAPTQSGILVPGEARALATMDLNADGWPDFAVTRRHANVLIFRNQGQGARRPLALQLRGDGVAGARVTLSSRDGPLRTVEIAQGSSYMSQSSSVAFFTHSVEEAGLEVRVAWPDGQRTRHPVAQEKRVIEIVAPARLTP